MQNLSVREFKNICDALSPKQFVFSSENQNWDSVEHTMKLELTFEIMTTALNPNSICLRNTTGYLCLNRVKHIKMYDKKSMLGSVFTVICGNSGNNSNDIEYTIIAR